jgi:hypothetical protein
VEVIFHRGSADSGHYISNIFTENQSIFFDDDEVSIIYDNHLSDKYLGFQAYLLFYEINECEKISLSSLISLSIPDNILQEIQKDNKIYYDIFLAFSESTAELFLKTNSLDLLLKYFFNVFIYSIHSQFCEQFKSRISFLITNTSNTSNLIIPFLNNFNNIGRIFTDNNSMTNAAQIILSEMLYKSDPCYIHQFIIQALHYIQSNIASIENFSNFIFQFKSLVNINEILTLSTQLVQSIIKHYYHSQSININSLNSMILNYFLDLESLDQFSQFFSDLAYYQPDICKIYLDKFYKTFSFQHLKNLLKLSSTSSIISDLLIKSL